MQYKIVHYQITYFCVEHEGIYVVAFYFKNGVHV
jgi:hypothetical protein